MARAFTYPFTLYFFLVFLPFLPFSIGAMLAAGGGFLILAPTFLFVVHTRRLWEEGCALAAARGAARTLACFAALVLAMPALYTAGALLQRAARAGVRARDRPPRRRRGRRARAVRRLGAGRAAGVQAARGSPRELVMLACGNALRPLPADAGGWAVFDAPGTSVYARAADAWALANRAARVSCGRMARAVLGCGVGRRSERKKGGATCRSSREPKRKAT